jgi:prepilin peptidase CpaA
VPPAIQFLLVIVAGAAAVYDLRERRVPNWLALAGVLMGVGANVAIHSLDGLWFSLAGAGLALVIYLPLYLVRAMGAGDAKLMAAVGALAGPSHWVRIFLCTAIVGALLALVLILKKGRARETLGNLGAILSSLAQGRAPHRDHPALDVRNPDSLRLPHAVSIACGTAVYLIVNALT